LKNIEEYENEYQKLKNETDELYKNISGDLKKIINRLTSRRGGIFLSLVKNNSCSICGFNLPPQLIHEIKTYTNFYHCPACSRILYYEEEEENNEEEKVDKKEEQ